MLRPGDIVHHATIQPERLFVVLDVEHESVSGQMMKEPVVSAQSLDRDQFPYFPWYPFDASEWVFVRRPDPIEADTLLIVAAIHNEERKALMGEAG